jgi:hypothetical protein
MAGDEVDALGARERMSLKLHSNNVTCVAFWCEEVDCFRFGMRMRDSMMDGGARRLASIGRYQAMSTIPQGVDSRLSYTFPLSA